MKPILSIGGYSQEYSELMVYEAILKYEEICFVITLDLEVFVMKWEYETGWQCNGLPDYLINEIGALIEDQDPAFFQNKSYNLGQSLKK